MSRVVVRIGHLRQVVPDALTFSWNLLTERSELEGATLDIEHVPAVVVCISCGAESELDLPVFVCRACGNTDVELVRGDEFLLVSLDLEEAR